MFVFLATLLLMEFLVGRTTFGLDTNPVKLSSSVLSRAETATFMKYALSKMGGIQCLTYIWDDSLDTNFIESLDYCPIKETICSMYKYQIHFQEGVTNTTMLELALSSGYRRQCGGYVIIMKRKEKILQLLHYGDNFNLINTRARFLIWYRGNDKSFERNSIWTKITNVIFFHATMKLRTNGIIFTIRELIWPISANSKAMRVRVIEFWSRNDKQIINNRNQEWFHDNSNDLRNISLRVIVVEHPPGVIKLTDSEGQKHFGGTEIEILKVLSSSLNFNYELTEVDLEESSTDVITNYPDLWAKFGRRNNRVEIAENGAVDGDDDSKRLLPNDTQSFFAAASKLINSENGDGADVAIGSFYVLREYLEYLDMSIPLDVACTSFLTPIPYPKPKYLALVLPFRYKLWLFAIIVCFILGPLILHALTTSQQKYKNEHDVFRKSGSLIFTSFSIMAQVPLPLWPKYWPIRWFIGWYWIFWICLTLAYRASMVAFLTIPLSETPIDTLHELQESGLNIGGWGLELYQLFTKTYDESNSEIDVDKKILSAKYEIVKDLNDAISKVAAAKFALYENVRYLQFIKMTRNLSSNGSPTMRLMKQCVVPVHVGFAYQKHSPLTLMIDRKIQIFMESGLLIKWRKELILKKNELVSTEEIEEVFKSSQSDEANSDEGEGLVQRSQQKVLGIHDLQGCFYFLMIGFLISLLVFIGELIIHRFWSTDLSKLILRPALGQGQLKSKLMKLKLVLLVEDEIYKEFTKLGERRKPMPRRRKGRFYRRQKSSTLFPFIE